MTHTLTEMQEAVLQRGGLCLASLFDAPCCLADLHDYRCRLPEWADGGMFGDEYCPKCEHKPSGCHMGALESEHLVYHFCAWVEQRAWDAAHPETVRAPERRAA